MADVEMPQLGETVTEGTITKWFKEIGDEVAQDEVLFEVSTDKVDSEVPSPAGGYLAEILVPEGETVDVGTKLAVLSDAPPDGAEGASSGGGAEAAPEPEAEAKAEPAVETPVEPEAEAKAEPEPEPETEAPAEPEPAPAPQAPSGDGSGPRLLSPVVRRLISEHQLDPASIEGTGVGGRITRKDVLRVVESGGAKAAPPAERPRPAPAPAAAPRSGERDSVEPLNNIRRRTGEHMLRSKETSPHVLTATEVDFERVERVRRAHRAHFKDEEGFSLTYLPFVARAVVDAIDEFPHMNAAVGDGELIVHHYVNLAIAVDLDFQGLLAPVVRDAETKRLPALAAEIHDLAGRARSKQLSADEIAGGTFTITNPGQYGTFMQFPIINQPQAAILSTDGIKRRPVVVADDDGGESIAIHSVGILALAWDHRAFDGAYAAAFLAKLRDIIETRDWEVEL